MTAVQGLCNMLVANDLDFTSVDFDLDDFNDDDELELIFAPTEKNRMLKELCVVNATLSIRAALSLASALLVHPKNKELTFVNVKIAEFGGIALAIRKNENLNRLDLTSCDMTPHTMENVRCLLSANAL